MLRLPTAFVKPPLWVINKKDDSGRGAPAIRDCGFAKRET